ncbi:hypothetical protein [Natrialba asiatica]|uniref:Uncharacterized protein n=1 Tax=Natrialba asiatica (strain ATCC 700177 / DSM 12278 / JCM 9576 / FERM P-10747 / NBRC 102637 / 172P1) TaxID=29540 RepID=M0B238_NATA1|nr:hypothetical protein [Natrialba asiatica]ELZ04850.1 hypothetical protein C481_03687 [Natrialba asiatica DSM 12278]
MRDNVLTLAVVALLALGASGVAAASMHASAADTASATALPANYTVDVVNPDAVSDEEVDQAIETAWANDDVQSYFDDGAAVHFEAWASEFDDDSILVEVQSQEAPKDTRVIADVDIDRQTVASVDEPVRITVPNAISINASDYDIRWVDGDEPGLEHENTSGNETVVRYTADQDPQIRFDETSMECDGDGTFDVEIADDNGTVSDLFTGKIVRFETS